MVRARWRFDIGNVSQRTNGARGDALLIFFLEELLLAALLPFFARGREPLQYLAAGVRHDRRTSHKKNTQCAGGRVFYTSDRFADPTSLKQNGKRGDVCPMTFFDVQGDP